MLVPPLPASCLLVLAPRGKRKANLWQLAKEVQVEKTPRQDMVADISREINKLCGSREINKLRGSREINKLRGSREID